MQVKQKIERKRNYHISWYHNLKIPRNVLLKSDNSKISFTNQVLFKGNYYITTTLSTTIDKATN